MLGLRDQRRANRNPTLQSSWTSVVVDDAIPSNTFSSPSHAMISALEATGLDHIIPAKYKNKVDYSFVSPRSHKVSRLTSRHPRLYPRPPRYQLQMVLAQYLRFLHQKEGFGELLAEPSDGPHEDLQANIDRRMLAVFTDEAMQFLNSKGYDASDVVSWARILTSKSSDEAASLLMAYSSQTGHHGTARRVVPIFIFLFLLRREQVTSQALKLFIIHAWDRLQNQGEYRPPKRWGVEAGPETLVTVDKKFQDLVHTQASPYPHMSEPTIIVMVIRLLRHARKIYPVSLQSISAMFTTYVTGNHSGRTVLNGTQMDEKTSARLSFVYNRVLHLLAIPSVQNPYRSVPYHQRAQFNVIRKMNEFEPALTINREGYRAVILVQLAHRKTVREREWAHMKARSWPPWKEEKVAIDAETGVELGISRANETLTRLQESGYAAQQWEVAAKILTGWDTDQSPTIQTRAIFYSSRNLRRIRRAGQLNKDKTVLHSDIWAARICATRTLDEAWACFLMYKDSKAPTSLKVYNAMFEKIVFDRRRRRKEEDMTASVKAVSPAISFSRADSGDGKEVSPPPTDPRDWIYVRSPPPSVDSFFKTMIGDGVRPSEHCLEFLLTHAGSIADGLKYIQSSTLSKETIRILSGWQKPEDHEIKMELMSLPDYLFASYIRFLCRFATSRNKFNKRVFPIHPLVQAYRLLQICNRSYRPAWYPVLSVLARPKIGLTEGAIEDRIDYQGISAWKSMLEILDRMKELDLELDFQGFQMLCLGFEKATIASHKVLAEMRRPIPLLSRNNIIWQPTDSTQLRAWEQNRSDAEDVIHNGPRTLKALFKRFVNGQYSEHPEEDEIAQMTVSDIMKTECLLPRLLAIPAPAELHAFIRALGLNKEYHSMLELVHWMVDHALDLRAVANELSNGSLMMRRCLIAIRAFLEGRWSAHSIADDMEKSFEVECAPDDVIQETFAAIDSVEEWGGLPSIEEAELYSQSGDYRAH